MTDHPTSPGAPGDPSNVFRALNPSRRNPFNLLGRGGAVQQGQRAVSPRLPAFGTTPIGASLMGTFEPPNPFNNHSYGLSTPAGPSLTPRTDSTPLSMQSNASSVRASGTSIPIDPSLLSPFESMPATRATSSKSAGMGMPSAAVSRPPVASDGSKNRGAQLVMAVSTVQTETAVLKQEVQTLREEVKSLKRNIEGEQKQVSEALAKVALLQRELANTAKMGSIIEAVNAKIAELQDRMEGVEGELQVADSAGAGQTTWREKGGSDWVNEDSSGDMTGVLTAAQISIECTTSNEFKRLLRRAFVLAMRLPDKMTPEVLPDWPADGEVLPTQVGSEEPVIRFRWEEQASHRDNFTGLEKICSELKKSLNASTAKPQLPEREDFDVDAFDKILQGDIMERVKSKYNQLARSVRAHRELTAKAAAVVGAVGDRGGDQDGLEDEIEVADGAARRNAEAGGMSKEMVARIRSRTYSKFTVRQRKLESLPENHDLRDMKYRPLATAVNLHSDDEDKIDAHGNIVPNVFVSRAPSWRSEECQNWFTRVDEIPDPNVEAGKRMRSSYIRERGPEKHDPPRSTNEMSKRARRWMFKDEWYNDPVNKDFVKPSCVTLTSGKAWGDAKEPEEIEAESDRVKEAKKAVAQRKKIKTEAGNILLGGRGGRGGRGRGGRQQNKGKAKETEPIASGSNVDPGPGLPGGSGASPEDEIEALFDMYERD
ncbi:hypothetical protein CVT24_009616 [Panaeolus cyanescens]|uniref:Uncharacterized protein n=1 Tax=Panaeolus cyanescens TaxID=181874 RepID=A0A409YA33_9AGAR|nr:hypothetical protein CVT24_009616 [Panaeolus cyanescens]